MKQRITTFLVFLSIILTNEFNFYTFAQNTNKQNVAIYMTGKDIQESYKKVIGAKLVSAITGSGQYAAVERTTEFLAALSSETDYQTSGEVRDSDIVRLGQRFGVKYVIVADASEVFDELFVTSRLINVETGLIEEAFDTSGAATSMPQLIDISNKIADGLILRPQRLKAQKEQAASNNDAKNKVNSWKCTYISKASDYNDYKFYPDTKTLGVTNRYTYHPDLEKEIKNDPYIKNHLKYPVIIKCTSENYTILNQDGTTKTIHATIQGKVSRYDGKFTLVRNDYIGAYFYHW